VLRLWKWPACSNGFAI